MLEWKLRTVRCPLRTAREPPAEECLHGDCEGHHTKEQLGREAGGVHKPEDGREAGPHHGHEARSQLAVNFQDGRP